MRTSRLVPLSLAAVLALGACSAGPSPSPIPAPSPTPTPSQSPAAFTIDVYPADQPEESRLAIPGSKYAFLVVVTDPSGSKDPVEIAATATKAKVLEILPASLVPGVVGEVWVVADPTTAEVTGSVTITATRAGVTKTTVRSLPVFPMEGLRPEAGSYFDRWLAWLVAEHPELGITADTAFEPIFVSTLLVVSHYAYWSPEWEITVAWHNMIAPYDFTEVYLRKRGVDTTYTLAFKIDSVSGNTAPYAIEPPESVVR